MTGVIRKLYTILILNVCKTRLKMKHKPDIKALKKIKWTMVCKGSFKRFLTVKYST